MDNFFVLQIKSLPVINILFWIVCKQNSGTNIFLSPQKCRSSSQGWIIKYINKYLVNRTEEDHHSHATITRL